MSAGRVIGTGRAADVFDIGAGRVLKRHRAARGDGVVLREALVMRHLRAHGFPVPDVHDANATDVVMERLEGTTMLTDLERRPWRLRRHARQWAELHRRLADVPVGDLEAQGVPVRFGAPESVLHLDLHPGNIMLTPDGPVVFDWTNAALGPAPADVAESWIVAETSTVDGGWATALLTRLVRRRLVGRFVDGCGRTAAAAYLPAVAEYRLGDRNVRPEEVHRIRALVAGLN